MKGASGERERASRPVALSRTAPAQTRPGPPPRDPLVAAGIGQPTQEIAMARKRRAETDEVATAQLVEHAQQMVLIREPAFVLRDHGGPIAVGANPKRIAPFAAAADI